MTVTFTNCADQPVRLFYSNSQRYEFVAEDAQDQEVWRWSDDQVFTESEGEETIAPGGNVIYSEVWDQRDASGQQVEPGRYQIFGFSIGCADVGATASGCRFGPGLLIEITP